MGCIKSVREICDKFDIPGRTHRNQYGGFGPGCGFGNRSAVGTGDPEIMAVDMNGVFIHAEVSDSDTHPVPGFNHQMINGGKYLAVKGEHIEVCHYGRIRPVGTRMNGPFVQHDDKIPINPPVFRLFRVDDEKTHHTDGQLQHFISVRMIHECAVLAQGKFVNPGFTRTDVGLGEADKARANVRKACEERESLIGLLRFHPSYDNLRGQAWFDAIADRTPPSLGDA